MGVILPAIHYQAINYYAHLGKGFWQVAWNIISEPERILIPYKSAPEHVFVGVRKGLLVMFCGGILLPLLRPWMLIALLGYTAQRYLSARYSYWTQEFQYSVELTPFLTILLIDLLARWQKRKNQIKHTLIPIFLTILVVASYITSKNNVGLHYKFRDIYNLSKNDMIYGNLPRAEINEALALLPDSVPVITLDLFAQRLYRREPGEIQLLDNPNDLGDEKLKSFKYLLVSSSINYYDTSSRDPKRSMEMKCLLNRVQEILKDPNFHKVYNGTQVHLLLIPYYQKPQK